LREDGVREQGAEEDIWAEFMFKMVEEAGSELVASVRDHLSKVKLALLSHSNMDKTLKEEAVHAVREMGGLLNRLRGMFLELECTLKKVLATTEKERSRLYSEQLATSPGIMVNQHKEPHTVAQHSEDPPTTFGQIIKAAAPNTSSYETKRLIEETVDSKALQLGVTKFKNLAIDALFVECKSKTDRNTLEKELSRLSTVTVGRPKRKLPTLLLMFVPKKVEDADIKNIILQQNNPSHIENPVLRSKYTKRTFEDSRHVVLDVSPNLRRELIAVQKIRLLWSMCKVKYIVSITKCLRFGHIARFCQSQQKCSY
jgi:hypothetical protein